MIKIRIIVVLALAAVVTLQGRQVHFFARAGAVNFTSGNEASPFSCNAQGNFWCGGISDVNISTGGLALMSPIPLNRSRGNYAQFWSIALRTDPVDLQDAVSNQWYSFNSNFQFYISSITKNGDGLAFVMLNKTQYNGTGGSSFGLYDVNGTQIVQTFAVEFDTYENNVTLIGDPDNNHVGVGLETVRSVTVREAGDIGLRLADRQIFTLIDFNSSLSLLEIRISSNSTKPLQPFLDWTVDMPKVFPDKKVYVGFSASNGAAYATYHITDWHFEQFLPAGAAVGNNSQSPPPPSRGRNLPVAVIAGVSAGSIARLHSGALLSSETEE